MLWKQVLPCLVMMMVTAGAQTGSAPTKKPLKESAAASVEKTESAEKTVVRPKSYDLDAMDKTVDPCQDFYQYACGSWRKNNPIPPDQSRWGRFNELADYNRQFLHKILEKDSANDPKRTPVEQKIGDMYQSCMDEAAVNKQGSAPLKPELDRIAAITTKDQLVDTIAYLQSLGVQALFGFGASPDLHNASMQIANVSQGGLGLPDRDYYSDTDPKSQETRQKYLEHLAKMFVLLGDDEEAVMMRDPKNRDHKMKVTELAALAPNFKFDRFFTSTGAPGFTEVNVVPPDFFQKVNGVVESVPVADWKTYLRWHAVRAAAQTLSEPFVRENFAFYGQYLNGQKEIQPRWKRCVQLTDGLLGEALGKPYVDATFGADGKARMLKMVNALEESLGQDIQALDWMTPETKKQAMVKLHAIANKIGYPDTWRDYTSVKIVRGDFEGDVQRARAFEIKRNLNKIGKPLDKKEWGMSPPTVNAYYSPSNNDINFPAGILQPPFFDKDVDDAVNFGGIGVVIGHELTHGFDDQGSKFDAQGNLTNWWTQADRDEFDKRTSCVADEYSSFVAVDDVHLNGRLTLGENTADNGGLRIALAALHADMEKDPKAAVTKDGFTPEQRFFVGFAQVWCQNATPESSRLLAKTDPHSPGEYRTNGTLQNSADFAKAFGCKAGQKMVSANACHVW
jgi:putative endopeptidase